MFLYNKISISVCHEHQFKDKYLFYRFYEDDQGIGMIPNPAEKRACEDELPDVLNLLEQIGPDAMMRMILRKLYASSDDQLFYILLEHGIKNNY